MQDFIRKDGAITEETQSSAPGFNTDDKTYFLRIEKEGTTYTCSRSDDGAEFTEMFAFEDTGIDADEIIIDAYTGLTEGYKFTLKSLTFEGGEPVPQLDKTAIMEAIENAEALSSEQYTDDSWAKVEEALAAAKTALKEATTQPELDAAAKALNDAVAALKEKPSTELAVPKDDYFADGSMNEGQWTILNEQKDRPDPDDAWSYYRFEEGLGLVMPTQHNSIYQTATPNAWKNMFTMPAEGTWDVIAKAYYPKTTTGNYQQVQVIAWQDEDNYVRINCQNNLRVEPFYETGGRAMNQNGHVSTAKANSDGSATFYFRIQRTGDPYTDTYVLSRT